MRQSENFFRAGLDRANQIELSRQISLCAHVPWPAAKGVFGGIDRSELALAQFLAEGKSSFRNKKDLRLVKGVNP